MSKLRLHYHPMSRAADVIWMLEELGIAYERVFVDTAQKAQKSAAFLRLNPMGKLPVIEDGDVVVSERAAIGVYLADKYAPGRLAPALDSDLRGAFLRWSFFPSAVIEPGVIAHAAGWEYRPGSAGWGTWEELLSTVQYALGEGPYLLGEQFTMADIIFGGTLRYMVLFKLIEPVGAIPGYLERLASRPALKRADALNTAERERVSK